jgi:hypothetical protein
MGESCRKRPKRLALRRILIPLIVIKHSSGSSEPIFEGVSLNAQMRSSEDTSVFVFLLDAAISYFLVLWTLPMLTNDRGRRIARKHVGRLRNVDRYSDISQ